MFPSGIHRDIVVSILEETRSNSKIRVAGNSSRVSAVRDLIRGESTRWSFRIRISWGLIRNESLSSKNSRSIRVGADCVDSLKLDGWLEGARLNFWQQIFFYYFREQRSRGNDPNPRFFVMWKNVCWEGCISRWRFLIFIYFDIIALYCAEVSRWALCIFYMLYG